uniref:Uncharacterized protein n=1 Tax=Sphaerodactylus townsendi TaxID=933632 RepID=A0ACB8G056_9SAUR
MWSLGTLVYVLLSGLNPFIAETNQQTIDNIVNAEYNFDEEAFKDISIEALDFVDRLLIKERKARMTAAEALEHTWLKQRTEKTSTKVIKTLKHMCIAITSNLAKKEMNTASRQLKWQVRNVNIRSQRGVTVAKVKVASIEIGPISGQIMHAVGEEGGHVKYVCKIENYDSATEVTWYFGVRQLENSEKCEISYHEGVATMYVKDITKSDDGTYRCKVVNDYGEDSSYAELFVKGVREVSDYYRCRTVKRVKRRVDTMRLLEKPPEFTLPLYNRTAYIGENIRFGVTITVHPEPRVTWFKSGQKIKPGDDDRKYTFETDKGLYQLLIHNVTEDDSAEYTVLARNKYGEDSCKAKLTVVQHAPAEETTLRPMFKRLLANAECQEGHSVCFEIRVSGIPKPTLKWEKDGQPISASPNIEIVHEGLDYYALHIRDTLPEDSGYYRVTATNSAGSTSCQAYLKVERLRYVKREYKSEEERQKHVQKQIDKTVRLAEILAGTESIPLTQVAQEALRQAAILYKPAVSTKTVKGEFELRDQKVKEEKRLRMPYEIPEPRRHVHAFEEDQNIKQFVPMSDMRWYKKLRDQYEMPGKIDRIVQKRQKRIRLSRWEQFYVMPLPRISDQYKPKWRIPKLTQDDLETVRPARRRTPSPDYEFYYRPRRRSLGDLSDDELLLPVDDYLAMKRTEEERLRLEEELELGFSASPPSRSPPRFELSSLHYSAADAQLRAEETRQRDLRYATYHIPSKEEASTSYAELRQRHAKAVYKPPKQRQRIMAEKEDEELLRPVTTGQKIYQYKGELEYMSEEEKRRLRRRREREITEFTSKEEDEEIEVVRHVPREFSPPSRLLGRRRSLSPTYIELMRPVSELIRPRSRPVEETERRSPTPERTRPRSPSPVSSERSLSRFERSARFDIFSRYESMKAALKTQKTMERKHEVLTQEPFTLDHAPRVTLRMRSHRVPCGTNTRFILNVQSKPTAEVKWYHNGVEIQESHKIHFTNTSGVLTLEILDCHIDDSAVEGRATRLIKQPFCSVESSVLSVREVAWYKDGKKLKDDEHFKFHYAADGTYELTLHNLKESDQGEYTCEIVGEGGISKTNFRFAGEVFKGISSQVSSFAKTQKAVQKEAETLEVSTQKKTAVTSQEKAVVHEEVKKSLVSEDIKKSYTEVKSTTSKMAVSEGQMATLKANIAGASDVKWFLNGIELANSEDYRYGVSGSDHTLTIKKATHKDEGILTCEGKTEQGIVKCHFDVSLSEDLSNAPVFIMQPKSQNVDEGQCVLLTCEVSGDPSPEIEWFKDNQPVALSSSIQVNRSKNVYSLAIKNAAVSDSGKYTVKAKNYHGQCSATASLTVLPLIEEPPKEVVLRTSGDASMQGSFSSQSLHMSASKQEASFSSSSSSSMTEMKFASMSAKSMSSMQESFVEMSSSSVMGKSSLTQLESSTSKMVKSGMRGIPPKIEALPNDISIEEGKVLTVSCAFSGEPIPDITWSCRGKDISSQDGRFHIETCEDLTTLIIMDVQKNDGGLYTLNLENDFGNDSAIVNINVRSI